MIGNRVLMYPPLADYADGQLLQATQVNAARAQFLYEVERKFPWCLSPTAEVWARLQDGSDVQVSGRQAPEGVAGYYLVVPLS
jgi:hypothetical protein